MPTEAPAPVPTPSATATPSVPRVPSPAEAAPQAFNQPAPAPSEPAATAPAAPATPVVPAPASPLAPLHGALNFELTPTTITWGALSVLSGGISGYHGFKRNDDSVGWGFLWAVLGLVLPVATPMVAVSQGFAKPSDRLLLERLVGRVHQRPDLLAEMFTEMGRGR